MSNHRAPVLILIALTLAACQPAAPSPAQTQAAQSAFNTAVAAAQTQAAPPPATPAPAQASTATSQPAIPASPSAATLPPDQIDSLTAAFMGYLEGAVRTSRPIDGAPFDAHVIRLAFQYYDNGNAAVVDIGVQKSDLTSAGNAAGAVAKALIDIYRPPDGNPAAAQKELLPPQMRVFRIHVYDAAGAKALLVTGNWEDVIARAQGTISADEFAARLKLE